VTPKAVHATSRTRSHADGYTSFVGSGFGKALSQRLGLPQPVPLRRYQPGDPLLDGPALVAGVGAAPFADRLRELLLAEDVTLVDEPPADQRLAAVVVDLSAARGVADLEQLRSALAPALKRLGRSGRVLLLGTAPETLEEPEHAATQRALEGITRSVAKELRAGATANALYVSGDDAEIASSVRFFLSGRSAYVDGQLVRVGAAEVAAAADPSRPLAGRLAVVTGAARGIGAAIVDVLARDGATVLAVDVPGAGQQLAAVANRVAGTALQLDVTAPDAGARIAEAGARRGGIDLVVHNAGITRDRLLVNTDADRWSSVLEVNLASQLRMDDVLLAPGGAVKDGGRVVSVSSMSGIAGNRGQVNYAASKAGVIGMVAAQSRLLAPRGITYNAVAPGFIETEMTSRVPLATREVGRRINSLSQGGLPVDVAETIAWFAQPGSAGVTGQVVRVCGQSMLGA
jgi:3-oxoacyl-[acyl-carrier protein] reductase